MKATHRCLSSQLNSVKSCLICENSFDKCKHLNIHVETSHSVPPSYSCNNMTQLDGNDSLLELSSMSPTSSSPDPSLYSLPCAVTSDSLSESFSSSPNLSMFLPYANYDITYDDISDSDSFFTQSSFDSSDNPSPTLTDQPRPPTSSKKVLTAQSLPNIMVTNHRSIFPKFNSLVDELIECEMHVGLHSEIWEVKEKIPQRRNTLGGYVRSRSTNVKQLYYA